MTRGRRALLSVLQVIKGREVAARVRVTPTAVSYWVHGYRRPSARSRELLERHLRIAAEWWDDGEDYRLPRTSRRK